MSSINFLGLIFSGGLTSLFNSIIINLYETNQTNEQSLHSLRTRSNEFRPYTVPADHKDFQVGDQAHICLYTDIEPYTVIERKGKRIKLQKARATLDPSYKPERIAGGFAGHCINNHDQKWIITA